MRLSHLAACLMLFSCFAMSFAEKEVLGKLGQATSKAPIYAQMSSHSRVYYHVKPYEYLVLQTTQSGNWLRVLMQNGMYGYIKAETVAKHGADQVKIWRRSYDIPPPALTLDDPRHPAQDRRYRDLDPALLPATESLKDTLARVEPLWEQEIAPMLREGRNRLTDEGKLLPTLVCDAEQLPFADAHFNVVCVAFGLRNMTHKDAALREMARVLKPGGKLLVLEFSKVAKPLEKAYDFYSFKVLPLLGKWVARDEDSYRYLAESIRMHPDQSQLKTLMQQNGLDHVDIHNLSFGVVALHVGIRC